MSQKRNLTPAGSWRDSPLLVIMSGIAELLRWVSPLHWWERRSGRQPPMRAVDTWVLLLLAGQVLFLACWYLLIPWVGWLAPIFAVYVLVDTLGATLRDIVLSPVFHTDKDGGYVAIRNRPRWLLLAALTVAEVVISFAILILWCGSSFKPQIDGAVTALYFSTITFTTLGYGDYHPRPDCQVAKLLVVAELAFVLVLITVKLPVAVSVLQVKQSDLPSQNGA